MSLSNQQSPLYHINHSLNRHVKGCFKENGFHVHLVLRTSTELHSSKLSVDYTRMCVMHVLMTDNHAYVMFHWTHRSTQSTTYVHTYIHSTSSPLLYVCVMYRNCKLLDSVHVRFAHSTALRKAGSWQAVPTCCTMHSRISTTNTIRYNTVKS